MWLFLDFRFGLAFYKISCKVAMPMFLGRRVILQRRPAAAYAAQRRGRDRFLFIFITWTFIVFWGRQTLNEVSNAFLFSIGSRFGIALFPSLLF